LAARPPFRPEEAAEVERAGRSIFFGDAIIDETGKVRPGFEEIWELRKKWWPLINLFLKCISKRNGEYAHFPVSGGAEEQPDKTMRAFDVLQEVYIGKMKADHEKKVAALPNVRIGRGRSR
jgi:hypothetical protein